MLRASGKQVSKQVSLVALAVILAGAVAGLAFANAAQAGPHGGGGGGHGGGGGSGWVILSYSPRDKRLVNQWAADHTTNLAGGRPVLVLDMYEHAYHMDYGAAAARYVDIYMEAIRWDNAAKLYEQYSRES